MASFFSIPLLLLLLFADINAVVTAGDATDANCGTLLPVVAAHCGYPDIPSKAECCEALRDWHRSNCWCDRAAFESLRRISRNMYAFAGRSKACGLSTPKLPAMPPIMREAPSIASTCPPTFLSMPKYCPTRMVTLNTLTTTRKNFRFIWNQLFVEHMLFINVGQTNFIGRQLTIDYLLTRQKWLGAISGLSLANFDGTYQWRSPYQVSYITDKASIFITFSRESECSPKIATLVVAEKDYLDAEYSQFFYASTRGTDVISQFKYAAGSLCDKIGAACPGKHYPFVDVESCRRKVASLKQNGRIMCNRFSQKYVPQVAVHGDSVACRATFVVVAKVRPQLYCPWFGTVGKGVCHNDACPFTLYDNIFAKEGEPRVSGAAGGFSCNVKRGTCDEQWP